MLSGNIGVQPNQIIGGAIRAAGLAARSPSGTDGGGAGSGGSSSGGAGSRGGGRAARASIVGVASRLGGFGAAVQAGGLDAGLHALGLDELRGKPPAEIIARISDHLVDGVEGLQGDLLPNSLRDAMFEAAALGGDPELQDLGVALQTYLGQYGPEGLAELFLCHFVFDRVWSVIESHVDEKSDGNAASGAMASAVQAACYSHVQSHMDEARKGGVFEKLDWFGTDGIRIGQQIVADLESRLAAL